MKNCPYCGSMLNDNAAQCHVCGFVYQQYYQHSQPQNYQQYQQHQQNYQQYQQNYTQGNYTGAQHRYYQQPSSNPQEEQQKNSEYYPHSFSPQMQYGRSAIDNRSTINSSTAPGTENPADSNRSGFNWIRLVALIICLFIGGSIMSSTGILGGIGKLFSGSSLDVVINEDFYISCAKTAIAKRLKSPSTAIWYNEKVVEQDAYGRVLITMAVEAQNGFGGYSKSYYAVVIYGCNPSEGTFKYNRLNGVQMCETEDFFDVVIKSAKELSNFGEPFEESNETE